MRVRILGSAAGGGLPQWNCRCANCEAARRGSPDVLARTQSSLAVSADGASWFLLNVSPDVRRQLLSFPDMAPHGSDLRGTPLAGCVLTDAEIDHSSGLLLLREGGALSVYSTDCVRRWLNEYLPIEPILTHFAERPWRELALDVETELCAADGAPSGLRVRAFESDRHAPRPVAGRADDLRGSVIGLRIADPRTGGRFVYAPGVATLSENLRTAVDGVDAVFVDGTFWDDREPCQPGIGDRTARDMGHLPVGDDGGSLAWLAELPVEHRIYVHINNTNPMLRRGSPEQLAVASRGVTIGHDGLELDL